MRRTIVLLAGVLLSVVALGSDSPKEYDDRTEVVDIEGTWSPDGRPIINPVLDIRVCSISR
jgi:hypothetical protein